MSEKYRPPSGPPPNKRHRVESHDNATRGGRTQQLTPPISEKSTDHNMQDAHVRSIQDQRHSSSATPDYDPPPGPPPGWQAKQRDVEMGGTSSSTYAPPPGPPPSRRQEAAEPPPYDPWHDATNTQHLPPPFAASNPSQRSPAANATYEEARRGHAWCAANPLWRASTIPNSTHLQQLTTGNIRLTTPPNTMDITTYQTGRGQTYVRSVTQHLKDTILLSSPPLYIAAAHSPIATRRRKTVYFEVEIISQGGSGRFPRPVESGVAIGFVAPPYPQWRLPGWHRGSLGVHGDDGRRYVDDSFGGREFVRAFRDGDRVGIGISFEVPVRGDRVGMRAEVFFTRNGQREAAWDLHEERDAKVAEGDVTGLEGTHDLLGAVGVFGFVEVQTKFDRQDWWFVPDGL